MQILDNKSYQSLKRIINRRNGSASLMFESPIVGCENRL